MFNWCRRAGGLPAAEKRKPARVVIPPALPAKSPAEKAAAAVKRLLSAAESRKAEIRFCSRPA